MSFKQKGSLNAGSCYTFFWKCGHHRKPWSVKYQLAIYCSLKKERDRVCVCVCGWGVCVVQNQIIDQKRSRKLKKTSLDNGTRTQAYPGSAYEWSFMIKISLVEWKVITKYNSVLKILCHIINVWCIFWKNDAFF